MVLALVVEVREEHHPAPVGRRVREPVGVSVASELFGPTAVRAHAPDLHLPTTERVVVDELPVGCVVRAVIEATAGRQASLLSTAHRDGIDVPLPTAAPNERECRS